MEINTAIIGGGAAGSFAAVILAKNGIKTVIYEPNKLIGRKLRITGKGRCNVTNNCSVTEFLDNIPTNPKFLFGAINKFTPQDTMEFFEKLGVKLKTERGRRVFPVSDDANEIADALSVQLEKLGVEIIHKKLNKIPDFRNTIIATGGMSYSKTGSDGSGYSLAKSFGHTIISPQPALVPLVCDENYCQDLMGLTLKNVKFSDKIGEMVFTHFGISGPIVLSSNLKKFPTKITIDLKSALNLVQLNDRILRDFDKNLNKNIINSLNNLLPKKIIPIIIQISGISEDKKVNSITKSERNKLAYIIKNFPLTVTSPRPIEEAIITSGGVSVREINAKTMESKIKPGLYFAGEIIDVDGFTGGFNLQIAFSTAFSAAQDIIFKEKNK
jgi:predicted Rossmann fold flavoprotein